MVHGACGRPRSGRPDASAAVHQDAQPRRQVAEVGGLLRVARAQDDRVAGVAPPEPAPSPASRSSAGRCRAAPPTGHVGRLAGRGGAAVVGVDVPVDVDDPDPADGRRAPRRRRPSRARSSRRAAAAGGPVSELGDGRTQPGDHVAAPTGSRRCRTPGRDRAGHADVQVAGVRRAEPRAAGRDAGTRPEPPPCRTAVPPAGAPTESIGTPRTTHRAPWSRAARRPSSGLAPLADMYKPLMPYLSPQPDPPQGALPADRLETAMRILMVGAGGVGSAAAKIAARRPFFETLRRHRLRRGARRRASSPSSATTALRRRPGRRVRRRGRRRGWPASTGATHVFNAVDPRFVMPIFDGALAAGADYLDMAMSLSHPHPDAAVRARPASSSATSSSPRRRSGRRPAGWRWSASASSPGCPTCSPATPPTTCSARSTSSASRDGANLDRRRLRLRAVVLHLDDDRGVPQPAGGLGEGPRLVHHRAVQRARGRSTSPRASGRSSASTWSTRRCC